MRHSAMMLQNTVLISWPTALDWWN